MWYDNQINDLSAGSGLTIQDNNSNSGYVQIQGEKKYKCQYCDHKTKQNTI